jgi:hypothetical protein
MADEFAPVPETADQMIVRWATRDAEYAKARVPMDEAQADAIRHMRKREASLLPVPRERARMYARAATWEPPKHQEFGDIKEWIE